MALGAEPATAQDLRGFLNSSYSLTKSTSSDGGQTEFSTDREALDLNWSKVVTPLLRYRLTLRGERSDSSTRTTSTGASTSSDATTYLVQPLADFTLASPGYSLNAGIRLREQFTESSTNETSQNLQLTDRNYFLRFFYTPQDLPSASFTFDRTTSVDDLNTRDTVQTRYQASTQYALKDLSGSYAFTRLVDENNIDRRARTQDTHLGNLGYSSSLFGDRLNVQVNGSGSHTTTTDEFFAPGTTVVNLSLVRGLTAGVDLSPDTSPPCPAAPCPPEAVVTAPGLSTGAGSVALTQFVSVGFELTAPGSVSQIGITVAPVPPFTLPDNLGSFITFRAFFTNDTTLATWTEIAGVAQTYDPIQRSFSLTFSATTARFFKAYVSQNPFGSQVIATGITGGNTAGVDVGQEQVRKVLSGAFNGGLTFTPVRWLSASYNLSLNGSRQQPEDITNWSGTHAANLTLRPHRLLTASGTYQYTFNESDQPGFLPTTTTSYGLTFGSVPVPALTTALTFSRSEGRLDDDLQNRSDSASLTAFAKVFPTLTADSTLTVAKADDFVTGPTTLSQGAAFNFNAQVLPRINTVFNYSVNRQEASPAPVGQDAETITHAIGGGTTYTLSRVVNFTTRFDYNIAPTGTAFSQSYKLDWIPTQRVSMFVSYRRSTQETQDVEGSSDSITGNLRWSVSRYVDLSANASYTQTATGSTVLEVQSYSVNAGFRF